jgi:hypothetical protein
MRATTTPPPSAAPRTDDPFELRIVTIDYYLAKPVPGLDVTHSAFLGAPVDKVRGGGEEAHDSIFEKGKSRHPNNEAPPATPPLPPPSRHSPFPRC